MFRNCIDLSKLLFVTMYVFCAVLLPALHNGGLICTHSCDIAEPHETSDAGIASHQLHVEKGLCQLCMIASIPQDTSTAHEYSPANNKIDIALATFTDLTLPKNKIKANPSTAPPSVYLKI